MKITLLKTARLPANEQALVLCRAAMEFKDKGSYEGAQQTLRPFWKRFGSRPNIEGLHSSVAAEILFVLVY